MGIRVQPERARTCRSFGAKSDSSADVFTALTVNPHTVFTYWEISLITQCLIERHFDTSWSDIRLALRVMDVTGVSMTQAPLDVSQTHGYCDTEPQPAARQSYIRSLCSGRSYVVDLGVWSEGQHFFTIVRSNRVHTPSVYAEAQLMNVRPWQAAIRPSNDWKPRFTGYSLER